MLLLGLLQQHLLLCNPPTFDFFKKTLGQSMEKQFHARDNFKNQLDREWKLFRNVTTTIITVLINKDLTAWHNVSVLCSLWVTR